MEAKSGQEEVDNWIFSISKEATGADDHHSDADHYDADDAGADADADDAIDDNISKEATGAVDHYWGADLSDVIMITLTTSSGPDKEAAKDGDLTVEDIENADRIDQDRVEI